MAAELEERLKDLLAADEPSQGFDPLAAVLREWAQDVDSAPVTPVGWPLEARKDYGPQGACAPKAALLAGLAVSLAAAAVVAARRWWR